MVYLAGRGEYLKQVEQLFRGGANTIDKQHFTLLYDCARMLALTSRNIRSGGSKAGLWPFNPKRVLGAMSKPPQFQPLPNTNPHVNIHPHSPSSPIQTSADALCLRTLRFKVEAHFKTADDDSRSFFEKFAGAAEKSVTAYALINSQMKLLENRTTRRNSEKLLSRPSSAKGQSCRRTISLTHRRGKIRRSLAERDQWQRQLRT